MIKEENLWAGGWLPKFGENMYHDAEEDYWWIPTAEVALTNMHRDEILEPETLPMNYVAYTPCFRREKMSAGRDVRGIKRGHQFDKVEMYSFVRAGEVAGGARGDDRRARRRIADGARLHLPGDRALHRRPRLQRGEDVRHRDLGAGLGRVARGLVGARTAPTSRRAARTSASAARRAASPSTRTRSTAPASRCRAR